MKKIGIIGGAGYTAGELLRLLINHPEVSVAFVHSTSNAGQPVTSVHGGLLGETDLVFSDTHPLEDIDILFLCSAHGHSKKFWEENSRPSGLKVIDLAQDFRDESDGYVYGLPEMNRERIAAADSVANPGCFATALQLSLLPLAAAGLLPEDGEINITALTGSTGAGVKPGATTHFSWRNDNVSVYKAFTHQHLIEIGATLNKLQPGHTAKI
ncbi:MAG: N-acetyl-gamma-glutamyl-phosphate reductase, partial [Muribaculaceae bacterium]|nr:N-acetyl-gamma-glutamyl-phosphate reductase [Muribaculaceae bacterium]